MLAIDSIVSCGNCIEAVFSSGESIKFDCNFSFINEPAPPFAKPISVGLLDKNYEVDRQEDPFAF